MPPAMLQPERGEITLLLDRIQEGDRQATSDLAALAFPELRGVVASRVFRKDLKIDYHVAVNADATVM